MGLNSGAACRSGALAIGRMLEVAASRRWACTHHLWDDGNARSQLVQVQRRRWQSIVVHRALRYDAAQQRERE